MTAVSIVSTRWDGDRPDVKAHTTPTQPKAFATTAVLRTVRHMLAAIVIKTATVFNKRMDLLTPTPLIPVLKCLRVDTECVLFFEQLGQVFWIGS